MARKKKEGDEEEVEETSDSPAEEPKEEKKSSSKALDVLDNGGVFVRTYSEEVHGKDFKGFAEEFAAKIHGKVVSAVPRE